MPTKESLIEDLVKEGYLKTSSIIEAFEKIDRLDFVPEKLKNEAYLNQAMPIGFGQTISQPLTVAFMLELLEPKPGEKILDVGAGSGWVSALLAYVISQYYKEVELPKEVQLPKIIGIERIPELKEMAEKNISKYNFIEKGIVKIILSDASKGYAKEAPYDKIIAGAAAEEIPAIWKEELKIGGRLVMPIGHNIIILDKIGPTEFEKKEFFGFSFVPLVKD